MNFLSNLSRASSLISAFNWYGFLIGGAMLVCIVAAYFMLKVRGYDPDIVFTVAIITIPCALVGLRVYYVIFDIAGTGTWAGWFTNDDDKFTLMKLFGFYQGIDGKWKFEGIKGLAIYGGLIAAAIGAIGVRAINKKQTDPKKHMTYIQMLDAFFILIILGQAIGRWGNYANSEAYGNYIGKSSWFPYGVFIENPEPGMPVGWYQATFFYESFANLIGFGLMFYLWLGKRRSFDGFIFSFYCIWYGTARCIIEGMRSDSLYIGSTIRVSQLLSGILILYGVCAIGWHIYQAKKSGKKIFIFVDKDKLDSSYCGYEKTIMAIHQANTPPETTDSKDTEN